jgi:hypothetical protein
MYQQKTKQKQNKQKTTDTQPLKLGTAPDLGLVVGGNCGKSTVRG